MFKVEEQSPSKRLLNQYKVTKIFIESSEQDYKPVYILHKKNVSPFHSPIITFVKGTKELNVNSLEALYKDLKKRIN